VKLGCRASLVAVLLSISLKFFDHLEKRIEVVVQRPDKAAEQRI